MYKNLYKVRLKDGAALEILDRGRTVRKYLNTEYGSGNWTILSATPMFDKDYTLDTITWKDYYSDKHIVNSRRFIPGIRDEDCERFHAAYCREIKHIEEFKEFLIEYDLLPCYDHRCDFVNIASINYGLSLGAMICMLYVLKYPIGTFQGQASNYHGIYDHYVRIQI